MSEFFISSAHWFQRQNLPFINWISACIGPHQGDKSSNQRQRCSMPGIGSKITNKISRFSLSDLWTIINRMRTLRAALTLSKIHLSLNNLKPCNKLTRCSAWLATRINHLQAPLKLPIHTLTAQTRLVHCRIKGKRVLHNSNRISYLICTLTRREELSAIHPKIMAQHKMVVDKQLVILFFQIWQQLVRSSNSQQLQLKEHLHQLKVN